MKLEIKKASFGYENCTLLNDFSMILNSGELLCLLGPNGVGKTTFFKSILRLLKLKSGDILIDDKSISNFSPKELSKNIAYVPQAHTPPFPFSVIDVVLMGRSPYIGDFSSPSKKDKLIGEKSLDALNIGYLKNKIYTELSGGERQLVLIARALCQEASILVMDEPTSNLDYGNQIKVLNLIKELSLSGQIILISCHNPNHALLYATKVALIKKDGLFSIGYPTEIITESSIKETYNVETKILNTYIPHLNKKICVPIDLSLHKERSSV